MPARKTEKSPNGDDSFIEAPLKACQIAIFGPAVLGAHVKAEPNQLRD